MVAGLTAAISYRPQLVVKGLHVFTTGPLPEGVDALAAKFVRSVIPAQASAASALLSALSAVKGGCGRCRGAGGSACADVIAGDCTGGRGRYTVTATPSTHLLTLTQARPSARAAFSVPCHTFQHCTGQTPGLLTGCGDDSATDDVPGTQGEACICESHHADCRLQADAGSRGTAPAPRCLAVVSVPCQTLY